MHPLALLFSRPVAYRDGLAVQEALHAQRVADRIPDTVLVLEHAPVVTLGNRGRETHLVTGREALRRKGVDLVHASRGGDVTYHGPGQLVAYPILRLGGREADAHGYLYNLEEAAVRTVASFGVQAWRREGMNGAWTEQGKIAAIGFRLKRWVTMHGMSLNVCPDLAGFLDIVPCGLVGESVASLQTLLGEACPALPAVRTSLLRHLSGVLQRDFEPLDIPVDAESPDAVLARIQAG